MIKLRIPKNYVDPQDEGLRLESPWIVPESAMFLAKLLKGTELVFDVGMGASTLFYARRCDKVIGIENNQKFLEKVMSASYNHGLEEYIECKCVTGQQQIESEIENIGPTRMFDLVSIDTVWGYDRSGLLKKAAPKLKPNGILVLDNYASEHLFPSTYKWTEEELLDFLGFRGTHKAHDFHNIAWQGRGTRIVAPL